MSFYPMITKVTYFIVILFLMLGCEDSSGSRAMSYLLRSRVGEMVRHLMANGLSLGHMLSVYRPGVMGQHCPNRSRAVWYPLPEQAISYASHTLSFSNGRWFACMPRAFKFTSPTSTFVGSGLPLKPVSLQPSQVQPELQQRLCA